jgi:hypothetical protein
MDTRSTLLFLVGDKTNLLCPESKLIYYNDHNEDECVWVWRKNIGRVKGRAERATLTFLEKVMDSAI